MGIFHESWLSLNTLEIGHFMELSLLIINNLIIEVILQIL